MKRIKMQLKRALVTALAVSMVVGTIDASCFQIHATELESEMAQGTIENVNYATEYIFNDNSIALPTADNFTTNIIEPVYNFTWYEHADAYHEPLESVPQMPGSYQLQVDVTSATSDMTASVRIPIEIEYLEPTVEATVENKEFDSWEDVVITAPEGWYVGAYPSKDAFASKMYAIDSDGYNAVLLDGGYVEYYLMNSEGYISSSQIIWVNVDKENPTAVLKIAGNQFDKFSENVTYKYFYQNPVSIEIQGSDESSYVTDMCYQTVFDGETYDEDGFWTSYYEGAEVSGYGAFTVYARVSDAAGKTSIVNSDGIVIYQDAKLRTNKIVYTKGTNIDKEIIAAFNGNTVKNVAVNDTKLTLEQFEVINNKIILKDSYLETLKNGEYTVSVSYNPCGKEYVENSGNIAPSDTTAVLVVNEVENKGTIENVDYATEYIFNDFSIISPEASNFKTDVVDPEYTFTWYADKNVSGEPMLESPKKPGDYTLKIDVVSATNEKIASLTLLVTIEGADVKEVATVVGEKEQFATWDEVVLAAPKGYSIAFSQNKWEFSGKPSTVKIVDSRGNVAQMTDDGEIIYYLMNNENRYISKAKTIKVNVREKNAPALGVIINGTVLMEVDEDKEIKYSYFLKSPASINISGYEEYQIVSQNGNYDENGWTEDTGVFEFTDLGAYNIYARTVEKGVTVIKTEGFVLYEDSAQRTYKLVYTKSTNADKLIKVAFAENTVKSISVGDVELTTEQYGVTTDGIVLKGSYLETLNKGEYPVVVTYSPHGREYWDVEGNEKPCQTKVSLTIEEPGTERVITIAGEAECAIEVIEGIAEVSESLSKNPELDTPTEILERMEASVQRKNEDITLENMVTGDFFTEDEIPEEGLVIPIEYPEGTSAETHDFVVAHMFTEDIDGHKAGEVEYPEVTEGERLTFTVKSLSPITIGWVKAKSKGSTVNNEKMDYSIIAPNVVATNPATGDNANIALWCLIMLGCAVVGAAVLNRKKKQ